MKNLLLLLSFFISSTLFSQTAILGNWEVHNEEYTEDGDYEEDYYHESAMLHDKCLHKISLSDDGQINYTQYNTDDCTVVLTKSGTYTYRDSKLKVSFSDMVTLGQFYSISEFTVEFPSANKMTWTAIEEMLDDYDYDNIITKTLVLSFER